ncbi:methyltransferase domain-containing protein [Nocardioides sp.]|uniref:class I SAM-dependent methyltransferase n=1 Tax=Nocardioides sp. TaxID=35761 RepID=UPI003517EDA5
MSWSYSPLVAELYDIDQPLGRSVGDVEWHVQALSGVTGPVLEPACGTGRVLIPLLEAGHEAEGVDHSPEMLEICRAHCRERGFHPVLHAADMTTFVRPQRYAAIVVPRGQIRNIEGREATRQALVGFRTSLQPGGLLMLDLSIPATSDATGQVEYWSREPFFYTRQTLISEYDAVLNRTMRYTRWEKWCDGELLVTELHRFTMQHWNPAEFTALLHEVGFTQIAVCADFDTEKTPSPGTRYWNLRAIAE